MRQMSSILNEGRSIAYRVVDLVPPWQRDNLQTIVFHHGLATHPEQWFDWLPNLVSKYRIVLFDMFGTGRSSLDGSQEDWSIDARIRDLWALSEFLKLGKFHFVGESYGGTIGMLAGVREPARFASLTICNASHHGTRITNIELFEATIDKGGVRAWSDLVMEGRFFPDGLSAAKRAWYSEQQGNHTPQSVKRILRELVNVDLAEKISEIELPVLLLHSDSSPFITVPVVTDMHRLIKGSELQIFAHSKHGLPFSHGSECSLALSNFLARLETSAK